MILSFTVEVDIPFNAEASVPYLKKVMLGIGRYAGETKVTYNGEQTKWINDVGRSIEYDLWQKGEISL